MLPCKAKEHYTAFLQYTVYIITWEAVKWMKKYFTNRYQALQIKQMKNPSQGSVLDHSVLNHVNRPIIYIKPLR